MKRTGILTLVLVLTLGGVALAETKSDYNHHYNLAKLKTWDFKSQPGIANDQTGRNGFWAERVRDDLRQQFMSRGFQKTDRAGADFLITYRLGTKQRVDRYYENLGFPGWHRRGWGPGWRETRLVRIPYSESTLVMDVTDARTGQLVWRGYDTRTIDLNKADKTIQKAVENLTKRFADDVKKSVED